MSKMSVFCISSSRTHANDIVSQLKAAGFFSNEISVLFPYQGTLPEFVVEKYRKAPGKVSSGGMLGTLGWLTGTAPVHIPGFDLLIGTGPILDAFDGSANDSASGDLVERLIGMGIPSLMAKRYDRRIRGGGILISTHTENATETAVASEIFAHSKAEEVCLAGSRAVAVKSRVTERAELNLT